MSEVTLSKKGAIGAEALKKWHREHPEGRNFRHGATSAHFRKRFSDARTVEGKWLRAVIGELRRDLGTTSAGQEIILARLREKLSTLHAIGSYRDRQPSVLTPEGALLPCLGQNYIAYSESLRRDIDQLYSLAARKIAKAPPSLAEYLAGKREDKP